MICVKLEGLGQSFALCSSVIVAYTNHGYLREAYR
jgi:hypothetical protein